MADAATSPPEPREIRIRVRQQEPEGQHALTVPSDVRPRVLASLLFPSISFQRRSRRRRTTFALAI
jgi:hypothetical protein